jgi:hypothetical protein
MTVYLLGESLPFTGGIQRMEAAPIKSESKWLSLNVALEEVQHGECTRGIRFGLFTSGLLNCDL